MFKVLGTYFSCLVLVLVGIPHRFVRSEECIANLSSTSAVSSPYYATEFTKIQAEWQKIQPKTPDEMKLLCNRLSLSATTTLVTAEEILRREMKHILTREHGLILSTILKSNAVIKFKENYGYCSLLLKLYDTDLIYDIISEAIRLVSSTASLTIENLSYQLRDLFRDAEVTEGEVELMARVQIDLFLEFSKTMSKNNDYYLEMALYFRSLRNAQKPLAVKEMQRLEEAIRLLPSSLQYLLFKPSYCLLNQHFRQFIYCTVTIKADDKNRFVFIWNENEKVAGNGAWLTNLTEYSNNNGSPQSCNPGASSYNNNRSNVKLKFVNNETKRIMHVESSINKIANVIVAWENVNSVPATLRDEWNVELTDQDSFMFTQDNRILCATDILYGKLRRYAAAYEYNMNINSNKCRWIAKECPRL